MRSSDGWCALTLSRPDDVDAVPALVESDAVDDDPWPAVQRWVAGNASADVTARAAPARPSGRRARRNRCRATADHDAAAHTATAARSRPGSWSPTCPRCGPARCAGSCSRGQARPSSRSKAAARPDGTRAGPPAFFDWMNSGKLSYAVDFDEPSGLRRLLEAADVVIESSRPAALAQPRPRPGGRRAPRRPGLAADHRPRHRRRAGQLGGLRRRRRGVRRSGRRHRRATRCSAATRSPTR